VVGLRSGIDPHLFSFCIGADARRRGLLGRATSLVGAVLLNQPFLPDRQLNLRLELVLADRPFALYGQGSTFVGRPVS
jgi:hypothetical protein